MFSVCFCNTEISVDFKKCNKVVLSMESESIIAEFWDGQTNIIYMTYHDSLLLLLVLHVYINRPLESFLYPSDVLPKLAIFDVSQ